MLIKNGGTLPTLTRTRQLLTSGDIPNSFYYSRLTTNGAGTSLGVDSQGGYSQKNERATRLLCGLNKKVTISFWASSIANKRISPTLLQTYGTGGSPSSTEIIKGTPITLTSSWTKYTQTFTTNTLVGKTFGTDNNDYVQLIIYSMWGTTFGNSYVQTGVTAETYVGSGTIDIAQVQLCAGDVALPFMPKSFEEELRACQRYYEKSYNESVVPGTDSELGCVSFVTPSTTLQISIPYTVRKRTSVTPTIYSKTGASGKLRDVTAGSDVSYSGIVSGENGFIVYGASTANHVYEFHYTVEAEL